MWLQTNKRRLGFLLAYSARVPTSRFPSAMSYLGHCDQGTTREDEGPHTNLASLCDRWNASVILAVLIGNSVSVVNVTCTKRS